MHADDVAKLTACAHTAKPLLEHLFACMLDSIGEICIVASSNNLDEMRTLSDQLGDLTTDIHGIHEPIALVAAQLRENDSLDAQSLLLIADCMESIYEIVHASTDPSIADPGRFPEELLARLRKTSPADDRALPEHLPEDNHDESGDLAEDTEHRDAVESDDDHASDGILEEETEDQEDEDHHHAHDDAESPREDEQPVVYDLEVLDTFEQIVSGAEPDEDPTLAGSESEAWSVLDAPDPETAEPPADPPADDEPAADPSHDEEFESPAEPPLDVSDAEATIEDDPAEDTTHDPFATPLDPNMPLDPTGAADSFAATPDPNVPLDPGGDGPAMLTPEQMAELMALDEDSDDAWGTTPLSLPPDKAELLQFMVSDIREAIAKLDGAIGELRDVTMRSDCGQTIVEISDEMAKVSEFFEFRSLARLVKILRDIGQRIPELPDSFIGELEVRVRAISTLVSQHCGALEVAMEQRWPLGTFANRIDLVLSGKPLHRDLIGWHKGDVDRLLELDQIVEGIEDPPKPESDEGDSAAAMAESNAPPAGQDNAEAAQPTIRVPKDRIEHLLDVVRQLVLSKNQMGRLARSIRRGETNTDRIEQLNARAEQLDRLVDDLQLSLMDTRMQAVEKLFARYDRVVRDIARLNDKEVDLEIVGAHTKIDKFVLEALSDPLGRILRFIASDDAEPVDQRQAAGKPPSTTITAIADNHGSHVRISLTSDGQGLDRSEIEQRAIMWELTTPHRAPSQDDESLFAMLLDRRFEDSPLAGLGTALDELNAETTITSTLGKGLRIDITIPVTSAVIPAMLVGLGDEVYAVPLQSVLEIVKAGPEIRHEVNGKPCVRIRGDVLASIDIGELLRIKSAEPGGKLAVVVSVGDERVTLMVDRILGHQEIVIEPLDAGSAEANGPFSGATIRDDGGVSLIFDLGKLFRHARASLAEIDDHAEELAAA